MLKNLFRGFTRSLSKKSLRAAATKNSLQFEALEHRRVLAAGTAVVENGTLNVCGTDAANRIVVGTARGGFFVAADFLDGNQFFSSEGIDTIKVSGQGGDDIIVATSLIQSTILEGNEGNDQIFGGSGFDLMRGGPGNDLMYGNAGSDTILGEAGDDTIFAGQGNDAVDGGTGNDTIHGNDGDDNLRGDAGNDTIFGSAGQDVVRGGDDDDTLIGGEANDQMFGDAGSDMLLGSFGQDTLEGGDGPDTLVGGANDDTLDGGAGADRMFGDDGTDTINGGEGNDLMFAGLGPDTMFGGEGSDRMYGGIGNDVIVGDEGEDSIFGGDDMDILIGGSEMDLILGDNGQDFIVGGTTSNDGDANSLDTVRSSWTQVGSYDSRVSNVESLFSATSDSGGDRLRGNGGPDAFIPFVSSDVEDNSVGEQILGLAFVAGDDTFIAAIGETISVNAANGILANDGTLGTSVIVEVITQPRHGDINLQQDGSFTYTQTTQGHDFFIYQISNVDGDTDAARVDIEVGGEFPRLDDNATLTTLETGVQIFDFVVGSGDMPEATDTVNVAYMGFLPNGEIFDENEGIDFSLTNLIAGFSEGVQGMRPGGQRRIVIPPDQGYGASGNPGAGIGGEDIITFDVTLNSIVDNS